MSSEGEFSYLPSWMRPPQRERVPTDRPPDDPPLDPVRLLRFAMTLGVDELVRIAARDEAMRRLELALRLMVWPGLASPGTA
jgi:hypothetical protein